MIGAIEIWVQRQDGRQQVIRLDDNVTVRDLPQPPETPPDAPGAPLTRAGRAGLQDLLGEVRSDLEAFTMRGDTQRSAYAEMIVSRLTYILEQDGAD